jgi:hypothetical protein
MRQAIHVKYLGPTNRRGARLKASAQAGSRTYGRDYASNGAQDAERCAKLFAAHWGWEGALIGGALPDGSYVFVFSE